MPPAHGILSKKMVVPPTIVSDGAVCSQQGGYI